MYHVPPVFQFKHGDHACVFYSDPRSLSTILTPYIAEGLRKRERCFCAQTPDTLKALANDLRFIGVDLESEIRKGSLEIHSTDEVYFSNHIFEPDRLLEMLERSIEDSIKKGFSAFRTAGELSWAANRRTDCDRLIEYENKVQAMYPGRTAVGLCQYPIDLFEPETLERVIRAHSTLLSETSAGSRRMSFHVREDQLRGEIVADTGGMDTAYYYVVQHAKDKSVLGWGTASAFDHAREELQTLMADAASFA